MAKPENVVNHWHCFAQDDTESDERRVDICRLINDQFVVWILENDITYTFSTYDRAKHFVRCFIMGLYAKVAVDQSNNIL